MISKKQSRFGRSEPPQLPRSMEEVLQLQWQRTTVLPPKREGSVLGRRRVEGVVPDSPVPHVTGVAKN